MTDDAKKPPTVSTPEMQRLNDHLNELWDQIQPKKLPDAQLYAAIQSLIAKMPPREVFVARDPSIAEWVGEASAVLERWNPVRALPFRMSIDNIGTALDFGNREYAKALAVLHEARRDIDLRGEAQTSAFIDKGKVHDFYKELSTLIAQAKTDILLADRYLNAEFVNRYLPHVTAGARVRLLVRHPEKTLLPAIGPMTVQYGLAAQVRTNDEVHDRYLFVDGAACYVSGASFADGGKNSPTSIIPIVDFREQLAKYEQMWTAGHPVD